MVAAAMMLLHVVLQDEIQRYRSFLESGGQPARVLLFLQGQRRGGSVQKGVVVRSFIKNPAGPPCPEFGRLPFARGTGLGGRRLTGKPVPNVAESPWPLGQHPHARFARRAASGFSCRLLRPTCNDVAVAAAAAAAATNLCELWSADPATSSFFARRDVPAPAVLHRLLWAARDDGGRCVRIAAVEWWRNGGRRPLAVFAQHPKERGPASCKVDAVTHQVREARNPLPPLAQSS
jgi:hypothetical protein